MCKPSQPAPAKTTHPASGANITSASQDQDKRTPPARGMKAPEIVDEEDILEDDPLNVKASGLDRLRINLTSPASRLSASSAGVQTG